MKKKSTIIAIISMIILLTIIAVASYAFFGVGNLNISNAVNLNTITERNNMVFDTIGGNYTLYVEVGDMLETTAGNIAAENNTTLTVNFQANTDYDSVCTYDIIYEWLSNDKYQAHTSGVTENEFTIQAELASNAHVSQGNNNIASETDLSVIVGSQNSATVVSGAQIDSNGTTTNSAIWTITTRFHNADADQTALAGKTYSGRFKVANVTCVAGTRQIPLVDFLVNDAPRSGTDAVSNSPWILTSDHTDELRYAGKNPDNYIEFNGELWRIIGVMPNMEYCTGTYGMETECNTTSTGTLVKIIRNQTISSSMYWDYKQTGVGSSTTTYGSNDWSDSQLMLMLNGTNYLKTGYDVNGNKLHQSYTITSNVVARNGYNFYNATYSYLDGNETAVYKPSEATTSSYTATSGTVPKKIESSALNQIATVKWDLYGTNSFDTAAEGSPAAFYNKERNINNIGAVYTNASLPENRPVYWYGKIGLMYPSDYGYASNGGSTYNRNTCLGYNMNGWNSGDYKTDCALNNYLLFQNKTSTAPGTSGTSQWTLSPRSGYAYNVFYVVENGFMSVVSASNAGGVRPVLYLKAETEFSGGTGTWNDPYTISEYVKKYWYSRGDFHTFPSYGGTLQTSGSATGNNVYIGQDNSKYYACTTISGHEVCLSQPYTQYGLSGHTLESDFTAAQQASVKQAIYQTFIDAGISVDINNDCYEDSPESYCVVDGLSCGVDYTGNVYCNNNSGGCMVDQTGRARCDLWS